MPPCSRMAATVSAKRMPRGICSRRKSPITSPWSSVFISSPGITIEIAVRARARRASSAPPKTLWSVIAIAPSPSASAWSSRSSTASSSRATTRVHVQVGDDPVAVARADPLSRRAGRRRPREALVERVELGGDVARSSRLGLRARCGRLALAQGVVLGEARDRRGRELGLLAHAPAARRSRRRRPSPRAGAAASPSARGRRSPSRSAGPRAAGLRAGAHVDAFAQAARDRTAAGQRLRAQQRRLPVRAARAARAAPARARAARSECHSSTISFRLQRAGRARGRRPAETTR